MHTANNTGVAIKSGRTLDSLLPQIGAVYIGIDPGQKGALGFILDKNVTVFDMPLLPDKQMDAWMIGTIISSFIEQFGINQETYTVTCCLEKAQAMPKQGVTSVFNYGTGYGKIKAMLEWFKIPYEEIRPAKWKKEFSLDRDKAKSVALAKKLFPTQELVTKRGRLLDGRAEALLMAEYARRRMS